VNYNSCFTLFVYDTYGDGICCGYGEGNIMMINSQGDTLVTNNGDFGSEAEELFCADGGCALVAEISTTNASNENATDGTISINPNNGMAPYQYSIDGGESFFDDNTFTDLAPGTYTIVVKDESENCVYEETIELEFNLVNNIDVITSKNIKVFPNPTKGNLVIELDNAYNSSDDIKIEIFDYLGLFY